MTSRKLNSFIMSNYIIYAVLSSVMSFLFLRWRQVPHAAVIAVGMFVVGGAISGYRYFFKQKAYIQKRYMEIPQIIFQRREERERVMRS